jgi:hypothetical protein
MLMVDIANKLEAVTQCYSGGRRYWQYPPSHLWAKKRLYFKIWGYYEAAVFADSEKKLNALERRSNFDAK